MENDKAVGLMVCVILAVILINTGGAVEFLLVMAVPLIILVAMLVVVKFVEWVKGGN